MAESEKTEVERIVRKLRKKLREIDRLERRSLPLTTEEKTKVDKKSEVRDELLGLLADHSHISTSALCPEETTLGSSVLDKSSSVGDELSAYEEPEDLSRQQNYDDGSLHSGDSRQATSQLETQTSSASCHEAGTEKLGSATEVIDMREKHVTTKQKIEASPKAQKKKKPKSEDLKCGQSPAEKWKHSRFLVRTLTGHNGLVTAVALQDNVLLTGSQDTTVRRWDVVTCEEVRSLCGHSDSVTAVILLAPADSRLLATSVASFSIEAESALLGISGSLDCYIKIWNLDTGDCLKSIYTFNPLTCLKLFREGGRIYIICGTGGGKLELWDLSSAMSCPVQSMIDHKDAITAIFIDGKKIYSASVDGAIKVYEMSSDQSLHLIYNSEDVETKVERPVYDGRRICSIAVCKGTMYFGNEGANIKAIDWKSGSVRRLVNHTTEFGNTSCLLTDINDLLISTGYDLDHGYGYINVRSLPDEKYLFSLCDEETNLIVAMAASSSPGGGITMVTGGVQLKIWKQLTIENDQTYCQPISQSMKGRWTTLASLNVPRFDRPPLDSDVSDPESDSDHDFHDLAAPWQRGSDHHGDGNKGNGWLSWCSLV